MKDTSSKEARAAVSLPKNAQDAIGRRLRESLDRIVAEPIPERFLRLLDDLERSGPGDAGAPTPAPDARLETSES